MKFTDTYYLIHLILLSVISILFFSCTKEKKEDKRVEDLTGTWEQIEMTTGMPLTLITFYNDSVHTVEVNIEGEGIRRSYFIVTLKNYKYYLTLDGLHPNVDGRYLIIMLNKKILIIERIEWEEQSNPFFRREFVKLTSE